MKEPAIADSTCLIGLERIGQLSLLPALFEPLVVPPKVREEFSLALDWLQVQAPIDTALVVALGLAVGKGEAEAIALAVERRWLLILDDRKARRWAKRLGLRVIGTVGILLRAKRQGLIEAIKPLLEALKAADFCLSPELEEEALHLAGERRGR